MLQSRYSLAPVCVFRQWASVYVLFLGDESKLLEPALCKIVDRIAFASTRICYIVVIVRTINSRSTRVRTYFLLLSLQDSHHHINMMSFFRFVHFLCRSMV